ncbi:MAG: flagellar motor switch protein FliN [Chthonomonadaceae bacterium]|nr:flagellar motor switch protein FliN [Chthonomonadaceae bacterium]
MSVPIEVIQKIGEHQNQIWQTASLKASEAAGFEINLSNPLTNSVPAAELFVGATSPRLVVQFSFASMPENAMLLMIPQETYTSLIGSLRGSPLVAADDTNIPEIKPIIESITHGICQAVGTIKNDTVAATGISLRFQIPSFPPNLDGTEEDIRVNIEIKVDDVVGVVTWIMDSETAHYICGIDFVESTGPFESLANVHQNQISGDLAIDESLAVVMDIPLEVSVELGRVKMHIRDVVELGAGSIVEIDKAAGEPVDVYVNGRLVARGEVVVIDDNFGVRLTEILSIQDRLQKLNEAA